MWTRCKPLIYDDIAVSVSVLQPGDRVLVHRQVGARHTGLKIAEERWYER
jgi:3-dehydroquinate synthase class II